MIYRYNYNNPLNTGAVVKNISYQQQGQDFFAQRTNDENTIFTRKMDKDDIVFGLGETLRGINKRGWRYESYCSDDALHHEGKSAIYGAHNFLIIKNENITSGIFIDFPGKIIFDIGSKNYCLMEITVFGKDFDLYLISGNNEQEVTTQFRTLIGKSYIPPLWAFGYQQSRWGYRNAEDVLKIADEFEQEGIPLDSIYLDIDYMQRYKNFTVDTEKFPDFQAFVRKMKERGIRLVPIIDAGVKIEEGYKVYEEGVKNNYFCKREDGSDFVAGVWPGKTHFPDFLNKKASKWFGNWYKTLIDQGIEGFWNDMNEPAIFYSEEGIEKALSNFDKIMQKPLDVTGYFALLDNFNQLSNNREDHKIFFHNIDGKLYPHNEVHNLYGFYMTKSASEAFEKISPNKRVLMFSRSSYIGMHRYGGIWTGDNCSWWSHILLGIQQMASLNMCGFLYSGTDIGGFGGDTSEDLMLRWLQFGIFTPLMRNHSAFNTREQEPFRFSLKNEMKNTIELRYSLIPFIYSTFIDAAINDKMYFKPLSFDFPQDKRAALVEDQLFIGDEIMIAPIYQQGAKGRYVYLPEDMVLVKFKSYGQRTYQRLKKGDSYISVELDEIPIFIRKNKAIPLIKPAKNTDQLDWANMEMLAYIEDGESYNFNLYKDDGYSKNYTSFIKIGLENHNDELTFTEKPNINISLTNI